MISPKHKKPPLNHPPATSQPPVSPGGKETVNNTETRTLGRTEEQPLPDSTSEQCYERPKHSNTWGYIDYRLFYCSFVTVYKGLINGKPVAVKKLLSVGFIQEVQILMLPSFVHNQLNKIDFGREMFYSPPMSWYRCLTALGTARGLDYLHSSNHVHGDDKRNIFLDKALVPKISDFGLTRASAMRSSSTVLLEILSGVLPVDENCDPMFLVSKQNNGSFLFSTRLSSSYSGMNAYDLKKENISLFVLTELEDVVKSISLEQLGPEREADNMGDDPLPHTFSLNKVTLL
uniref:Serine-threonine/tyrosine-protein kinase catalytic domain-containing protein n=1 Tax=Oncorhynchus tshawytscha TaxID=74940 RepID=A0A8C8IVI0_ONCTS